MKIIIAGILALVGITPTFAQTTTTAITTTGTITTGTSAPTWIPTTIAEIRSWKLKQVAYIQGSVSANSILSSSQAVTSFWDIWSGGPDPDGISKQIAATQYDFHLTKPAADTVYYFAAVYDKSYHALFFGQNSFRLQNTTLGWKIPDGALNVEMQNSQTVFNFPNAVGARLLHADGTVDYFNVDDTGGLILPPDFNLGPGDQLLVSTYNQSTGQFSTYAYGSDGNMIAGSLVAGNFDTVSFDEVKVAAPNSLVLQPVSANGIGVTPLLVTRVATAGNYTVFCQTTEGEVPIGVTLENTATGEVVSYTSNSASVTLPFKVGLYHITFTWAKFHEPPTMDNIFVGGNG